MPIPNLDCSDRDALTNVEFRLADWPGHQTKCVELWTTAPPVKLVGVLYPHLGGFSFISKYDPKVIAAPGAISIMCLDCPGLLECIEKFARERGTGPGTGNNPGTGTKQ